VWNDFTELEREALPLVTLGTGMIGGVAG